VNARWNYGGARGTSVELRIPISGPRTSGILHIEARRVADEWESIQFIVEIGEEEIDVSNAISR
jgi:hypothetical protein